jgi:hypothetical protein
MAQLRNTSIDDTGNLSLPSGTTAQRPASPQQGMIRYNTTLNDTEYYDGTAWRSIADTGVEATGGTIIDTEIGGVAYRIHQFIATGNSTFTVTKGGEVEYLIVAGGGGGAGTIGGGGGAGGLLSGTTTVTPQSYTITVGSGGQGGLNWNNTTSQFGSSGTNSSALGFTAIGGGGGGSHTGANGQPTGGLGGGSGGGAGAAATGASGTAGQGNNGGGGGGNNGGGGGGAGSSGQAGIDGVKAGDGGQGLLSTMTGASTFYAGGGGGGTRAGSGVFGLGGLGGGGNGGVPDTYKQANDGEKNKGSGGGGGGHTGASAGNLRTGGDGGSGIVILRYRRNVSTVISPTRVDRSTLPESSQRDFLVQENLVLNLNASNSLSYAGSGTTTYSSQGTIWRNLANPSVNGTINNDITFERAAPDNGRFVFNGSNTFISTSNFNLGSGSTAWTLSAWINTTATGGDGVGTGAIASNASGGPVTSSMGVNLGRIHYWIYLSDWQRRIGNITVNDGRWHLLTWVNYPNSTMAMYVDGRLDVDNQVSAAGNNNPIDRFGGSWASIFDGRISQFTLNLNRFLTSSEISQIFNSSRWRFGV